MILVQQSSVLMSYGYSFVKCRIGIGTLPIIHSPRKGTHKPVKINVGRPKKQLRCRECSAHTSFKCSKCGDLEWPVPPCRLITGHTCCNTFHQRRIFDLSSSQRTRLSSQGDIQNWIIFENRFVDTVWCHWNDLKYTKSSTNRSHYLKKVSILDFIGASSWQESQIDAAFIFLTDVYLCIYLALYRTFRNFFYISDFIRQCTLISFQKVLRNPFSGTFYND